MKSWLAETRLSHRRPSAPTRPSRIVAWSRVAEGDYSSIAAAEVAAVNTVAVGKATETLMDVGAVEVRNDRKE